MSGTTFTAFGSTRVNGQVWLNLDPATNTLELVKLEGNGIPFAVEGARAEAIIGFNSNRFSGPRSPAGAWTIAKGQVTANGQNAEAKAVRLRLRGQVSNRPPVANPGGARTVECTSPTTTQVTLAGTGSDSDLGDTISHFQWFNQAGAGLTNTPSVSVQASLGSHRYDLHVYDRELSSDVKSARVAVVDTIGPQLSASTSPVCLWPPNHAFARFELGREISYSVQDTCDASPTVEIESVTSDENPVAPGSGSTPIDVAWGKTAACVRAERQGPGDGRNYTLVLAAHDASGNVTRTSLTVFVPHDQRRHPGCKRAEGLDTLADDRCRR